MLSRFRFSCRRGVRFPSLLLPITDCFPDLMCTPRFRVSTAESSSGICSSGSELPSPVLHGASVYRDARLREVVPEINSDPEKSAPSSSSQRIPSREVRRWKKKIKILFSSFTLKKLNNINLSRGEICVANFIPPCECCKSG